MSRQLLQSPDSRLPGAMSQFRVLAFGSDSTTGNAHTNTQTHPYTPHSCFISIVASIFWAHTLCKVLMIQLKLCHLIFQQLQDYHLIFQVKIGLRGGKLLCDPPPPRDTTQTSVQSYREQMGDPNNDSTNVQFGPPVSLLGLLTGIWAVGRWGYSQQQGCFNGSGITESPAPVLMTAHQSYSLFFFN